MPTPTPTQIRSQLHRFGLERDRLRTALCQQAGIAQSELDALEHLEADGPLTQRELGERLLLSSGGVTVLVDRLERSGLVTRMPHPSDRRAVLLELKRDALAELPEPLAAYHATIAAAARAIPAECREAVAAFLQAATANAAAGAEALRKPT
jgi:DNA-binding MarR family transcriptional regulator